MADVRTLLKRDEGYAIHSLIDIAENPGSSTSDVAERLQLPPAFTAKVVRKLVTAGFVASRTGRSGGLSIAVDLGQVSLLDVIEGISGPVVLDTCETETRCATQRRTGTCRLKFAWFSASQQIRDVLASVKLAQLCAVPAVAT